MGRGLSSEVYASGDVSVLPRYDSMSEERVVAGGRVLSTVRKGVVVSYRTMRNRPLCMRRGSVVCLVTHTTGRTNAPTVHADDVHSIVTVGRRANLPIVKLIGVRCPKCRKCVAPAVGRMSSLMTTKSSIMTLSYALHGHNSNSAIGRFVTRVGRGCPSVVLVTSVSGCRRNVGT